MELSIITMETDDGMCEKRRRRQMPPFARHTLVPVNLLMEISWYSRLHIAFTLTVVFTLHYFEMGYSRVCI